MLTKEKINACSKYLSLISHGIIDAKKSHIEVLYNILTSEEAPEGSPYVKKYRTNFQTQTREFVQEIHLCKPSFDCMLLKQASPNETGNYYFEFYSAAGIRLRQIQTDVLFF